MKTILKFTACVLFTGVTILMSCTKKPSLTNSQPAPQPILDTLNGLEFEFNDLTWREIQSPGTNVIVDIGRPDLFFNPYRSLKVTIRLDTSAVWLDVFQDTGQGYPAAYKFLYTIGGSDIFWAFGGHLYIFPVPANYSLSGTKVSVRVKFLS